MEIVIEGHKDQKGRYKSGAVATYTCAPSYHLTPANSAYRECKNGVWSGVNGTCGGLHLIHFNNNLFNDLA